MARQQRSTTLTQESTPAIARVALYARVSTLNNLRGIGIAGRGAPSIGIERGVGGLDRQQSSSSGESKGTRRGEHLLGQKWAAFVLLL